jgi:magnesium-transporting ATPase (P-type)
MIWNPAMEGTIKEALRNGSPWLGMVVSLLVAILPDFLIQYLRQRFWPTEVRIYAEKAHKQSMKNWELKKEFAKTGMGRSVDAVRFVRDEDVEEVMAV